MALADLQEGLRDLNRALSGFGTAIKEATKSLSIYTRQVARAHYNLLGQYTFPIDEEVFQDEGNANLFPTHLGFHQFFLFPVPIVAWLSSITFLPLLSNSAQSIPKGFIDAYNLSFRDNRAQQLSYPTILGIALDNDTRNPVRRYFYGGLGYLIGGLPGLCITLTIQLFRLGWAGLCYFWQGIYHNALSFGRSFTWFLNCALPAGYEISVNDIFIHEGENADTRHFLKKFGLGLPGFMIGSICGLVAMTSITVWRVLAFICDYVWRGLCAIGQGIANIFTFAGKLAWKGLCILRRGIAAIVVPIINFSLNVTSYLCGVFWNGLCAVARDIGYIMENNALSLARSFTWFVNWALPAEFQIPINNIFDSADDTRHPLEKFGIGLPGFIVGSVSGLVAMAVTKIMITAWRVLDFICDHAWRALCLFARAAVTVMTEAYRVTVRLSNLSWRGLCKLARGIDYIAENNELSLARSFTWFVNWALPTEFQIPINNIFYSADDTRHPLEKFGIGLPGFIVGSVSGLVAMAVTKIMITAWRVLDFVCDYAWSGLCTLAHGINYIIKSNAFSAGRSFAWFVNLALPDAYQIPFKNIFKTQGENADSRHFLNKFGIGLPGFILGSASGLIAMVITAAWRAFIYLGGFALDGLRRFTTAAYHSIAFIGRHVFRGISSIVRNNALSLARSFAWFTNIALTSKINAYDIFRSHTEEGVINNEDPRSSLEKYGIGIAGLMIGSISGIFSMFAIMLTRAIWSGLSNTVLSWSALSGSFINVAVERDWYGGCFENDLRSGVDKAIGAFGYLAACLTTLPFSIFVYTMRKLPGFCGSFFGASVMLGSSPLVLLGKSLSKSWIAQPRFDSNAQEAKDPIIQRFKNLYSSLTASGREFNVHADIVDQGDGIKSNWSFVRKCFTLNLNSITEKVLDSILEAYRTFRKHQPNIDSEHFYESQEYKAALGSVKDQYTIGCTDTAEEISKIHTQITKIADFIKTYLNSDDEPGAAVRPKNTLYSSGPSRSFMSFFRPAVQQAIARPHQAGHLAYR